MKPNLLSSPIGVDRLATPDEILAADLPDPTEECTLDLFSEIASDMGGYVRIRSLDFEIAEMVGELMGRENLENIE